MRKLAAAGIVAAAALAAVLVAGGAATDSFAVRLISETNNTITLGWSPQPGYGYLFSLDGNLVSRTYDASRSSVKFSKGTTYDIDVITKGANGHYPEAPPPPPPPPTDTGGTTTTTPPPPQTGYPDASNTGVPSGTTLTAYSGPTNISSATTITGKNLPCLTITGPGVVIRNSKVSGDCFYAIRVSGAGALLIEDSEVDCAGANGTGITDENVTARRVDVSRCENGFNVGGPMTVEDSYIHDLVTANGAHTDGMQFNQGASNITVRHNTINPTPNSGGATSCIIMWDEGNPQNSNVLITNNRLLGRGTAATIYTPRQGPLSNVRVTNNRMIPGQSYGLYNGGNGSLLTDGSGNVNDATGAPVNLG